MIEYSSFDTPLKLIVRASETGFGYKENKTISSSEIPEDEQKEMGLSDGIIRFSICFVYAENGEVI